jgi:phosphoribosyl-ATP pyrophosphohydrolase/phosphoribosyl-AMP cyclohydrolase
VTLRRPAGLDALSWNVDGLVPVVVQEVASGAVLMLAWADREAVARTLDRGEGWFWSRSRRRLWRKGETSGHALAVAEVAVDCDGDALLYRVDATGPTCHTGARSCFEQAGDGATAAAPPARAPEPGEQVGEKAGESAIVERPPIETDVPLQRLDEGAAGRSGRDEIGTAEVGPRARGGEGAAVSRADRPALAGPRLELGWLWDVLAERAAADPAASYTARLLAAGIDRVARKVGEEATEVVIAALRAAPASRPPAEDRARPLAEGVPAGAPVGANDRAGASAAPPLAAEAADLLYHLLVLLLAADVPLEAVAAELRRRHARPATPATPKPEGSPADSEPSLVAPPPEGRR